MGFAEAPAWSSGAAVFNADLRCQSQRLVVTPHFAMSKTTLDLMDESGDPRRQNNPQMEMVWAVTSAMTTYNRLLVLNGGGRREKRESLELSLDRNVILLKELVPKVSGEDLLIIKETLRDIRNYRRRFPRTDGSNQEQAELAKRILDEVPEV